ncbi:ABC transporter permease [Kocuria sp. TGY1127_2]|uniref:ABC transporter permease n=1 Tax=Kocuria sp. TGY1127_2 TaxID=2711328 RepID=UPI0015B90D0F|nr:ABC transporter permease [Kocuria sp. TGY1127_2]
MMAREFQKKLHSGEISAPWDHTPPAEESPYKELIASKKVTQVGRRPPLPRYVADIWQRRDFLLYDARARVRTQNSHHRLGSFWLIGKPILDVAFYFIVFGLLLKVDRGIDNYVAYVTVGVLMFRYSSVALTQSVGILRANRAMIHAFSFPRASLVLSFVLREALAAGPLVLAMVMMVLVVPPHVFPAWSWLLIFPLLAIQTLFNLGLAFIVSRLAFGVPDVSQAMSFLSRILMYGSGVIFPVERFISHPVVYDVMTSNPVFILLRMYRTILLDHSVPSGLDWLTVLLWGAGLTVFGLVFFWGSEEKYGRP